MILLLRRIDFDLARQVLVTLMGVADRAEQDAVIAGTILTKAEAAIFEAPLRDAIIEVGTRWFPRGRREVLAAWQVVDRRRADAARAKEELAASCAALRAVEDLIARADSARQRESERQSQAALDDIWLPPAPPCQ